MGEKDITEKILFDHNDIFADVVNVLLFNGREVILPDDLESTGTVSQYKFESTIHEQERDVSKKLKKEGIIISLFGIENQTVPEKFLPARIVGYDGASYRSQLLQKDVTHLYPVITVVLYYGLEPWNYSRNLTDILDIPSEFRGHINDYVIKDLYEIAYLRPEQAAMFKSDFRYIADYLIQKRTNREYVPHPGTVRHVDEFLKLMSALSEKKDFDNLVNSLRDMEGTNVKSYIEQVREEGILLGIDKGLQAGKVLVYHNEMGLSVRQIADKLGMETERVNDILKNNSLVSEPVRQYKPDKAEKAAPKGPKI